MVESPAWIKKQPGGSFGSFRHSIATKTRGRVGPHCLRQFGHGRAFVAMAPEDLHRTIEHQPTFIQSRPSAVSKQFCVKR
jgi:hypothetical protein